MSFILEVMPGSSGRDRGSEREKGKNGIQSRIVSGFLLRAPGTQSH